MVIDKQIIRNFLMEATVEKVEVGDDSSLLELGLLDSFRTAELLTLIEDQFNVTIDDDEMIPENFETLNAIVSLLEAKSA
jgi:acyl carrier protein